MRPFSRQPPWPWRPSRCSSLESTGPGGWLGSADDGGRRNLASATAKGPRARRVGLNRMAVDLEEPRRGNRPVASALFLPLLPPPDLVARVLATPGGGRHDLLDPEHRKLVPLCLRRVPNRTASPGHLRGVPARQGPVPVRRRVLEHHPGAAGPRGARNHPRDGDVGVPDRMARHRRMHLDDLGSLLGHRDCGVQPAAEPARGVARRESDLHAPRDSFTSVLPVIPTPSGVAGTPAAASGHPPRPPRPTRAPPGTPPPPQSPAGRRPSPPFPRGWSRPRP